MAEPRSSAPVKQLVEDRVVTLAYLALLLAAFAAFYGMIRLCERL